MASRDERELDMSRGVPGETDVPASEEAFSLEEIPGGVRRRPGAAADGGRGAGGPAGGVPPAGPPRTLRGRSSPHRRRSAHPLPGRGGERTAPAERGPAAPVRTEPPAPAEPRREEARQEELPRPPRPVTLEDVVGSTVDAVMEERREPLLRPRRGLFSRRGWWRPSSSMTRRSPSRRSCRRSRPSARSRLWRRRRRSIGRRRSGAGAPLAAAMLASLLPAVPMALEAYGWEIAWWTGNTALQCGVMLACLAAVALLGRHVIAGAIRQLAHRRCTADLLAAVSLAAMAADCGARLLLPGRSPVPCYAPVGCFAMAFAMWGGARGEPGPVGYLPHGRRR